MSQGRPGDPRKQQQWQRWIDQWQASGLTVRAFCARHRLAEPSFYAWRRQLRPPQRLGAGFVPVRVLADPEPAAEPVLEIVLAGGRRLRVPAGFDAATLRQVLAVLEEASPC
ncbi:MAG: IS66 family insertion sequence element accessory protein TnpB [Planctomycetes bacterium]|nr:IS66 family insertion sequence element accessory protein TnpB [Planctomycetota bacterium]